MIDPRHLWVHIIKRTLEAIDLWSIDAGKLVLGTACQETQCGRYLVQLGDGPALGIYQIEAATHNDIHTNFLAYRPKLLDKVKMLSLTDCTDAREMIGNLYYATAMCRVHYLRVPAAIPSTLAEQAQYYKTYFNSPLGKATTAEYISAWQTYIGNSVLV